MLRLRRRRALRPLLIFLPLAVSCNDSGSDSEIEPPPTRIVIEPSAFMGDLACGEAPGAFQRYQATIYDVTNGLRDPITIPSSRVVPCTSAVTFQFVQPGHRYIAEIVGFDRADVSEQLPGSPVVVDEEGHSVQPRWTTTCWGYDGDDYGWAIGGAGGAIGGASSDGEIGVEAYINTAVRLRGCDPLDGLSRPDMTGLSLNIEGTLVGRSCGEEPGEVYGFIARLRDEPPSTGGAGGAGGAGNEPDLDLTLCGDTLVRTGLSPGVQVTFAVDAYQAGALEPSWSTECRGYPVDGVIVPANCDPLFDLE